MSRNLRDRRAVARYGGLTGSPDESGKKRREKGLARSGNARVRRGMIQLAWRFLEFQKDSALAKWFRARTENARGSRKKMVVALAHRLVALRARWRRPRRHGSPSRALKRVRLQGKSHGFGLVCRARDGSPITVRGGGVPVSSMALMPSIRMGPPPRSSPPMRMHASWFESHDSPNTRLRQRELP